MATLSGPFRIDRMEVPEFYVVVRPHETNPVPIGTVLARTNDHHKNNWITLGFVSAQTPLGQGAFMGFEHDQVRKATPAEVIAALKHDHPHGKHFRPHCTEASDSSFHLIMSGVIANWTNDDLRPDAPPLHNMSRRELIAGGNAAAKTHRRLMRRWRWITRRQIKLIIGQIGAVQSITA